MAPESTDFQMAPLDPQPSMDGYFNPPAQPSPDQFLQANPNLPRIQRPDGSVIQESYQGIPGAPVPPQQQGPPDPMQALYHLARSGNQRAQTAFIHALQVNSELSHRERLQMQRMEAAVGQVTNNPNYTFEEKSNAIMQLRTGIDFYRQRDQRAQQKALAEQRQAQADALKQQAALTAAIQGGNDEELAKLMPKISRVAPDGTRFTVFGNKLTVTPPEKERDYAKDFDQAHSAIIARKSKNPNRMPGDPEPTATPDEVKEYMRDMYRVADEIQAERKGGKKEGAANPQGQLDAIKRDLQQRGIKRAVDAPPEVQKMMRELMAAGAK